MLRFFDSLESGPGVGLSEGARARQSRVASLIGTPANGSVCNQIGRFISRQVVASNGVAVDGASAARTSKPV